MAQITTFVDTLKKALKSRGFTYRDVAKGLKLSEASIKRLFATGNFTLARLDSICRLIGMDVSDLVKMADAQVRRISELTQEQEQELISDIRLLLVAFLVVNNWQFDEILQSYRLTGPELIRCLTKLDKLKMIELLPGNRIKLLISPSFAWRRNGPIQHFFTERMQDDFFRSNFDSKGEAFLFASGMLSENSITELAKAAERLISEFNSRNRDDAALPMDQRFAHSLVLAVRPWRPLVFSDLRGP
jgi:transcriptional regulator with XRE-family HTH domain